MVTEKKFLVAKEVAELLRTNPQQIYDWVREKKFPANCFLRIGRKILFDLDALNDWAANGGSPKTTDSSQGNT